MSAGREMTMSHGNTRQRPLLAMIDEDDSGEEARVTVVLGWDDKAFEGEATGSLDNSTRPRLVGEATLRAVERVAEGRLMLDLTAVGTAALGESQVAVAQVHVDTAPDGFVGSALIREADPSKATARAVLDAINRQLESVLS